MVNKANFRAPPVNPGGEDPVHNERRFRAEVERSMRSIDQALTVLSIQASEILSNVYYVIPEGAGSEVWEDFNEVDWTGTDNEGTPATAFLMKENEIPYLSFDRDGIMYVFNGVVGENYGMGATLLTDGDLLIPFAVATPFAVQADYDVGTIEVAVDPALGNMNYLVKNAGLTPAAEQLMYQDFRMAGTADIKIGSSTSDAGVYELNRNGTVGSALNPVTITHLGTLKGDTVDGDSLTINAAVIDCGTF